MGNLAIAFTNAFVKAFGVIQGLERFLIFVYFFVGLLLYFISQFFHASFLLDEAHYSFDCFFILPDAEIREDQVHHLFTGEGQIVPLIISIPPEQVSEARLVQLESGFDLVLQTVDSLT